MLRDGGDEGEEEFQTSGNYDPETLRPRHFCVTADQRLHQQHVTQTAGGDGQGGHRDDDDAFGEISFYRCTNHWKENFIYPLCGHAKKTKSFFLSVCLPARLSLASG